MSLKTDNLPNKIVRTRTKEFLNISLAELFSQIYSAMIIEPEYLDL